jgi:hypothetical protein
MEVVEGGREGGEGGDINDQKRTIPWGGGKNLKAWDRVQESGEVKCYLGISIQRGMGG